MINYPNKKNQKVKTGNSHSNRGMNFESEINNSNQYYVDKDIAHIYKKPTPIKVIKVEYSKGKYTSNKHKISEAYFQEPSTTDYNGIYRGKYIDFEAKQCLYNTFNIGANLKGHQYKHLLNVYKHGGIAFLFIQFNKVNKTYILEAQKLEQYVNEVQKVTIPIEYFEEHGYEVEQGYNPPLNYLKVIDTLIDKE